MNPAHAASLAIACFCYGMGMFILIAAAVSRTDGATPRMIAGTFVLAVASLNLFQALT